MRHWAALVFLLIGLGAAGAAYLFLLRSAPLPEGRGEVGRRGGQAEDYEDRTKDELLDRAREVGIDGRSKMSKDELIDALRNH